MTCPGFRGEVGQGSKVRASKRPSLPSVFIDGKQSRDCGLEKLLAGVEDLRWSQPALLSQSEDPLR